MLEEQILRVQLAFSLRIVWTDDKDTYILSWSEIGMGEPVIGRYLLCEGDTLQVEGEYIEHRRLNGIVSQIVVPRPDIIGEFISRGYLEY